MIYNNEELNAKLQEMAMPKDPNILVKHKFRWVLNWGGNYAIVKVMIRPQLDIEEIEINFCSGKMWIPGKSEWQDLVTYMEHEDAITMLEDPPTELKLILLDGHGYPLEEWTLMNVINIDMIESKGKCKECHRPFEKDSYFEDSAELRIKYEKVTYTNKCSPPWHTSDNVETYPPWNTEGTPGEDIC